MVAQNPSVKILSLVETMTEQENVIDQIIQIEEE